ncbi:MAG: hypothetical protein MI755_01905 [Sphingomonadales bacterium]|nr:hypothetical protein [Sphingomonadales bacterium]
MKSGFANRIAIVVCLLCTLSGVAGAQPAPRFEVDAGWQPRLPDGWLLGEVSGIAVDARDHLWVLHRTAGLTAKERGAESGRSHCCIAAPPVLELDPEGRYVQGWGGPDSTPRKLGIAQWPASEHGIFLDRDGFVWLTGNAPSDGHVLKFDRAGSFVLQVGARYAWLGDRSTRYLGRPADIWVDEEHGVAYIADGYRNHRIVAIDAADGTTLAIWGANGSKPGTRGIRPYNKPVHCVAGRDGLLYVCDRRGNRVQVFRIAGRAELAYLREIVIAPETAGGGSAWDVTFSPDGARMFVADGENERIWVVDPETGAVTDHFGTGGHHLGQFSWLHSIVADSRGFLYTSEVRGGRRIQRFRPVP